MITVGYVSDPKAYDTWWVSKVDSDRSVSVAANEITVHIVSVNGQVQKQMAMTRDQAEALLSSLHAALRPSLMERLRKRFALNAIAWAEVITHEVAGRGGHG